MSDELAIKRNTSGLSKPGMTNNPNGRPKVPESVKLAFSGMMPLALDALRNVLDGTDKDAGAKDRLKAAEMVFDRNLGKPLQQVENKQVDDEGNAIIPSIQVSFVDPK